MKWYIAGSIDNNPDFGVGSRAMIRDVLEGIGHQYIDPIDLEANRRNIAKKESLKDILEKSGPDWNLTLQSIIAPIVNEDIEAVVDSDGVVAILDKWVGSGTASECTLAKYLRKPIVSLILGDIHEISAWTLSRSDHILFNLSELKDTLKKYEM